MPECQRIRWRFPRYHSLPYREESLMINMHAASVPVFQQMLGGLDNILAKAGTHVAEKKIDPNAFLQARLFPDMFTFTRQVQIACDFAKGVSARLAGADVPVYED